MFFTLTYQYFFFIFILGSQAGLQAGSQPEVRERAPSEVPHHPPPGVPNRVPQCDQPRLRGEVPHRAGQGGEPGLQARVSPGNKSY